jgi:predicted nucleotidyltransferase
MKNLNEIINLLSQQKNILEKDYYIKKIGIFGSYSRGEQTENSDLDILVDLIEPVNLLKLIKVENHIQEITGLKVDLLPRIDIREEIKENILKEVVFI